MSKQRGPQPYQEPPEGGIGGEGSAFDLSSLAPSTDPEIEQGIHEALVLDPDVDANDVVIRVEGGIAYLAGHLASSEERRRAIRAATIVHGVRRVVDQFERRDMRESGD
jgi:osmotically-inducible protein OsmY